MNLSTIEPRPLWAHFFSICAIPHPSHREKELADWVLAWAAGQGIEAIRDEGGNVILRKPASKGREKAPGVILQAHLDMVSQATPESGHDFSRDPIRPRPDPANPGWISATGTTLGADNGIGVAEAMALMEDKSLVHGPLECLFTLNEEDGMGGAREVKPDALRGSILLNLDGEDDTELCIGCAGTLRIKAERELALAAGTADFRWFELRVSGLLGGHSGVDIDKGRGNASLLLCRAAAAAPGARLALLEGGTASNAIPRDARALLGLAAAGREKALALIQAEAKAIAAELAGSDPGFAFGLEEKPAPDAALSPEDSAALFRAVLGLPNGLFEMEPDMPGLVRSSSNLGELRLGLPPAKEAAAGRVGFHALSLVRSSVEAEKERIGAGIEAAFAAYGAATSRPSEAPAWTPDLKSPLLALARAAYTEVTGAEAAIRATHGGLECGLFRPRFPHWDMISLGPNIRYPHSPDERVEVASVERFHRFARALVEKLAGL